MPWHIYIYIYICRIKSSYGIYIYFNDGDIVFFLLNSLHTMMIEMTNKYS